MSGAARAGLPTGRQSMSTALTRPTGARNIVADIDPAPLRVAQPPVPTPDYRFFPVTVLGVQRLSPSFLRLTFTGPALRGFGAGGADQRIKLVFSRDGRPVDTLL